jgi:FkbM family methyltransferase
MNEILHLKSGIKLEVFSKFDVVSNILRRTGEFDPWNNQIASLVLSESKKGNVVDIGSHIGTFSIPLAKVYSNINFITFEVQRKVFEVLNNNINLNKINNIKTYNIGLSDKTKEITLSVPDYDLERNIGAFSLSAEVRSNSYEVKTIGKIESFDLVPLDDFNIKDILLIKLDVEGHELNVLKGGLNTIRNNGFPPIIFECWNWKFKEKKQELFNFLQDLGYSIKTMDSGNDHFAEYITSK